MRKSLVRRLGGALLATLALTFAVSAVPVFAADPAGVVRSGESEHYEWDQSKNDGAGGWGSKTGTNTFLKDAPIGTITLDTGEMNILRNSNYEFASTNSDIYIDTDDSHGRTNGRIVLNETLTHGTAAHDVDGTFTIKFFGLATLQDGSKADVLVTYSNLHVAPGDKYDVTGPINSITGASVGTTNNVTYNGTSYPPYGLRCDINVKVVDSGGNGIDGTVLFSTVDLDVGGRTTFTDSTENDNYRESFQILGGAVSEAYIPTSNYIEISGSGSNGTANGVKFTSQPNPRATNASGDPTNNDNGTFESGFVVLADSSNGISLRWWGQGNGMGTTLFAGNIAHSIRSTTTKGGSIKTTTSGKIGEGDDLGPIQLSVPDGKDVSYLMEPEKGYQLGKILIDGKEIDPDDSSTWPDFIEVTKDSSGNPIVTFKDNAANHTIDVAWAPEVTAKTGTGGSISDEGVTTVPGEPVLDDDGNPVRNEDGSIKMTPGKKRYTFTPDDGYTIDAVKVNGKEVTPVYDSATGTWYFDLEDVDEPTEIEVSWKRTYTVTFTNGDHGTSKGGNQTGVPSGDNPEGGNSVTPNNGYRFTGTYKYTIVHDDGTIEEGETDDPTSIPVTGNITFEPIYEKLITVTYIDPATGQVIQKEITIGENDPEPDPPADPTRDGYTFVGWKRTVDGWGNIIYEAMWEPIPAPAKKKAVPAVVPATGDVLVSAGPIIAAALLSMGVGMYTRKRESDE